jgi:hypothetical protein
MRISRSQIARIASAASIARLGNEIVDFDSALERARRNGTGWRFDGIEDWPTEDIFGKLGDLGIYSDPAEFRDLALLYGGPEAIADGWSAQAGIQNTPWDDYFLFASTELWRRLTPDILCPEIVAADLDRAVEQTASFAASSAEDLEPVATAVSHMLDLLSGAPPPERPSVFEELQSQSGYELPGLLLDFVCEAGDRFPDLAIRMVSLVAPLADGDLATWRAELPFALLGAGRKDAAMETAEENLRSFGDRPLVLILTGDLLEEAGNESRVKDLYLGALAEAATPEEWEMAVERLESPKFRDDPRVTSELAAHPRPSTKEAVPLAGNKTDPVQLDEPQLPYIAPRRVGPNEPCPCGSGRKYKKCCRP